jgi:hypothetical protein
MDFQQLDFRRWVHIYGFLPILDGAGITLMWVFS